ncbi:dihydropteroate synthase [bacterium]|nr:dihydropteroate synthase [bacterium]
MTDLAIPFPTILWRCRDRVFECGPEPLVAGILNVTPDSFSDAGRFADLPDALEQARLMEEEGADILDIGGESTRPGSEPVPVEEELRRVIPVIEGIRGRSDIALSVDTSKAEVARHALEAGADIVNDVTALRLDPEMAETVARYRAGLILMHMRGTPRTMQKDVHYEDVVREVREFLVGQAESALEAGIPRESICLDPGIGFAKTIEHNVALMTHAADLRESGYPVLVGLSRKSFVGKITRADVADRLPGSLAAAVIAFLRGADILRVHDVAPTRRALAVASAARIQLHD